MGEHQTRGALLPLQGADRAKAAGIPVYTVALGTPNGVVRGEFDGVPQTIPVPPDPDTLRALRVHLCFSVPAAVLLPIMLYTGLRHRARLHVSMAVLFSILWAGTFVTGLFFLPHN